MLQKSLKDKINITKKSILFCREPQLIKVLFLICNSYMS